MILWRLDDLTFAEEMEGHFLRFEILERLVEIFEQHQARLTLSLVTRYGGKQATDHPRMVKFLRHCYQSGHTIAGHGLYHRRNRSFREMSRRQLESEVRGMIADFTSMDLPLHWICYPFNHGSSAAEEVLHIGKVVAVSSGNFFDQAVGAKHVEFSGDRRCMTAFFFWCSMVLKEMGPNVPVAETVFRELTSILFRLRRLETVVKKEAEAMALTFNVMENDVLWPLFLQERVDGRQEEGASMLSR